MARRATHNAIGIATGAMSALLLADNQSKRNRSLEVCGGCFGGSIGSWLPDKIDPATGPNHRSLGHGILPIGCVAYVSWEQLKSFQDKLRQIADELAANRSDSMTPVELGLNQIAECICRILAGMIPGVLAGYISHLALDFTTPKGLPLVG